MNTWFEFKGVSSDEMGAILSNTPPITRAPKRYNKYEIDYVDGCEIEELGYSAYEKTINIGVKDYSKIDTTLDWLTGNGKLVIYNEQDKYYDATILNQIDYEKLIRYGTAKVAFLVQPYKHALYEQKIIGSNVQVFNEGNIESLPRITVKGKGEIIVTVNGDTICTLKLNNNDTIILDSKTQDAYNSDSITLANRKITGEFPRFKVGINSLVLFGDVASVETEVMTRWV